MIRLLVAEAIASALLFGDCTYCLAEVVVALDAAAGDCNGCGRLRTLALLGDTPRLVLFVLSVFSRLIVFAVVFPPPRLDVPLHDIRGESVLASSTS